MQLLFPCSTLLTIQILFKNKLKIVFNIYPQNKNSTNFLINYEILFSPSTLMSKTKV
jgi:hypothetical protein